MAAFARKSAPNMWTISSVAIIFVAFSFIETIRATNDSLFQIFRDLNDIEKVHLPKDPLRSGQKKWPFAVCALMQGSPFDQIYCNVHFVSSEDDKQRRGCGSFTYIRDRGQELRATPVNFQVGALISSEKVIVSFEEPDQQHNVKRKIFIWNLQTCDVKSLELSYAFHSNKPSYRSYVILYNTTFDVVIADKSKCGVDGKCRLTYNDNGDLVKVGPAFPLDVAVESIGTVRALSPEGGFFAVGYSDVPNGKLKARFISESGISKSFDTDLTTSTPLSSVPISTAYSLYTLCGLTYVTDGKYDTSVINCRQFDLNTASPKLNVTFEYPKYINAVAIYNIPHGGFLSAVLECGRKSQEKNCSLLVDKIQAGGQKSGLYMTELQSNCDDSKKEVVLDIEHQNQNRFCFHVMCPSKPYEPGLPNRLFTSAKECKTLDHVLE